MNNRKIRIALLDNNLRQWELAKLLGKNEPSMSRMLRDELPDDVQTKIVEIIENSKR